MGLLAALVEKSLLAVGGSDDRRQQRLSMLESTSEYAAQRLDESGERGLLARRHCLYYRALCEEWNRAFWSMNLEQWLDDVQPEIDNLRAALEWGLLQGNELHCGTSIAARLCMWWLDNAARSEGRKWTAYALDRLGDDAPEEASAPLYLALARFDNCSGVAPAERALALYESIGDATGTTTTLLIHGETLARLARHAEALQSLEEAVVRARQLGHPRLLAAALIAASYAKFRQDGLRAPMLTAAAEWRALLERAGDRRRLIPGLSNMAEFHFANGASKPRSLRSMRRSPSHANITANDASCNVRRSKPLVT